MPAWSLDIYNKMMHMVVYKNGHDLEKLGNFENKIKARLCVRGKREKRNSRGVRSSMQFLRKAY